MYDLVRRRGRVQEIFESRFLNLLYSLDFLLFLSRNSEFKCHCYLRVLVTQVAVNWEEGEKGILFL